MANACKVKLLDIKIDSLEYLTISRLSNVPDEYLYPFVSRFYEQNNRFPHLDEIPHCDSSEFLKLELHISRDVSAKNEDILQYSGSESLEEAQLKLNDLHRDLEIKITPFSETSHVNVLHRPGVSFKEFISKFDIGQNANISAITSIFDKLNSLYGIQIYALTTDELVKNGWHDYLYAKAFIKDSNIYINTDLADIDAPIHELTHLLIGSLKFSNSNLYNQLVQHSTQFEDYKSMAKNYIHRTESDVNEEIFVEELSRYLVGKDSEFDKLDLSISSEIMYNVKRMLDTLFMGDYSVNGIDNDTLFNLSLRDIADIVNSSVFSDSLRGNFSDAQIHRMLANKKSDLMKKGLLKEYC